MSGSRRDQPAKADSARSVRPRKGLGQHFLVDAVHRARIVEAAELTKSDAVLEIGPGRGEMTELIAAQAGKVIAVELDDRLVPFLGALFEDRPWVTIMHGDILETNIGGLMVEADAARYKVVANLPYYITGAAIRRLLETEPAATTLILTVQAEVAERIVARPPGRIFWRPASSTIAGRNSFTAFRQALSTPYQKSTPQWCTSSESRTAEARMSRMISSSIPCGQVTAGHESSSTTAWPPGWRCPHTRRAALLHDAGVDPNRRGETLSIEEWQAVARRVDQASRSLESPK